MNDSSAYNHEIRWPSESILASAIELLRSGGVVGIPTETVYGLAAVASQPDAVARIFDIKGRPKGHPVIVHVGTVQELSTWASTVSQEASLLASAFWPGPLTMVMPRHPRVCAQVTGGRETVAVRMPAHPVTLALLRGLGEAVVAPSANPFGGVSPTRAEHVASDLGDKVDLIVDGGSCQVGIESTIVDLTEPSSPAILRAGAVTRAMLNEVLGGTLAEGLREGVAAPGTLKAHYQPRARVEIVSGEELARRHAQLLTQGYQCELLDTGRDHAEGQGERGLAQSLYSQFRAADARGAQVILVPELPGVGLSEAIMDRIRRAAAQSPE